ncbi:MAG: hypothetical protein ABGX84_06895 [Alcanivorax sp.]|jgi:hypothetical protein
MDRAAGYFSSLIDEEVSEADFYRVANGRVPTFMKPKNGKGIVAFAGFYEGELRKLLLDAGVTSDHDPDESIRIGIPKGSMPELNFLEDELPYPLLWSAFDVATVASQTSDGTSIYWLLWDSIKEEMTPIEPYDLDSFEMVVTPKDVYELAMQTLDDDYWPAPDSQVVAKMQVTAPSRVFGQDLESAPTEILSAPVTAFQADDGFDALFPAPETQSDPKAKPQKRPGYNWPLIAGALLELLTEGEKMNQAGVVTSLVSREISGLKQRTLDGALADAKRAYSAKTEK